MIEQLEKYRKIKQRLSETNGQIDFFGLFLRENSPDRWDLLIAADWAIPDKKQAIDIVLREVMNELTEKEMLMLSRVVIINNDDSVRSFQKAMTGEKEIAEFYNQKVFGLEITHGFVINSDAPALEKKQKLAL